MRGACMRRVRMIGVCMRGVCMRSRHGNMYDGVHEVRWLVT